MQSLKIMIINPDWGMTKEKMKEELCMLSAYVSDDVELHMKCLTKTKVYLDSVADAAYAGPEILSMVVEAGKEYDAVVLYCFSDPAVEACRQMVSIPVVGAGQAACFMIPQIAHQGLILLADKERIPEKKISILRTGIAQDRIAGFEGISLEEGGMEDRDEVIRQLVLAGKEGIRKTGAQVLVLGCLSFLGMAKEIQEKLQVPVIDAAAVSVSMAELMIRQGFYNSPKAYLTREASTYNKMNKREEKER